MSGRQSTSNWKPHIRYLEEHLRDILEPVASGLLHDQPIDIHGYILKRLDPLAQISAQDVAVSQALSLCSPQEYAEEVTPLLTELALVVLELQCRREEVVPTAVRWLQRRPSAAGRKTLGSAKTDFLEWARDRREAGDEKLTRRRTSATLEKLDQPGVAQAQTWAENLKQEIQRDIEWARERREAGDEGLTRRRTSATLEKLDQPGVAAAQEWLENLRFELEQARTESTEEQQEGWVAAAYSQQKLTSLQEELKVQQAEAQSRRASTVRAKEEASALAMEIQQLRESGARLRTASDEHVMQLAEEHRQAKFEQEAVNAVNQELAQVQQELDHVRDENAENAKQRRKSVAAVKDKVSDLEEQLRDAQSQAKRGNDVELELTQLQENLQQLRQLSAEEVREGWVSAAAGQQRVAELERELQQQQAEQSSAQDAAAVFLLEVERLYAVDAEGTSTPSQEEAVKKEGQLRRSEEAVVREEQQMEGVNAEVAALQADLERVRLTSAAEVMQRRASTVAAQQYISQLEAQLEAQQDAAVQAQVAQMIAEEDRLQGLNVVVEQEESHMQGASQELARMQAELLQVRQAAAQDEQQRRSSRAAAQQKAAELAGETRAIFEQLRTMQPTLQEAKEIGSQPDAQRWEAAAARAEQRASEESAQLIKLQEQMQLGRSESAAELQQGWHSASALQQQISELEAQLVVQQGEVRLRRDSTLRAKEESSELAKQIEDQQKRHALQMLPESATSTAAAQESQEQQLQSMSMELRQAQQELEQVRCSSAEEQKMNSADAKQNSAHTARALVNSCISRHFRAGDLPRTDLSQGRQTNGARLSTSSEYWISPKMQDDTAELLEQRNRLDVEVGDLASEIGELFKVASPRGRASSRGAADMSLPAEHASNRAAAARAELAELRDEMKEMQQCIEQSGRVESSAVEQHDQGLTSEVDEFANEIKALWKMAAPKGKVAESSQDDSPTSPSIARTELAELKQQIQELQAGGKRRSSQQGHQGLGVPIARRSRASPGNNRETTRISTFGEDLNAVRATTFGFASDLQKMRARSSFYDSLADASDSEYDMTPGNSFVGEALGTSEARKGSINLWELRGQAAPAPASQATGGQRQSGKAKVIDLSAMREARTTTFSPPVDRKTGPPGVPRSAVQASSRRS